MIKMLIDLLVIKKTNSIAPILFFFNIKFRFYMKRKKKIKLNEIKLLFDVDHVHLCYYLVSGN